MSPAPARARIVHSEKQDTAAARSPRGDPRTTVCFIPAAPPGHARILQEGNQGRRRGTVGAAGKYGSCAPPIHWCSHAPIPVWARAGHPSLARRRREPVLSSKAESTFSPLGPDAPAAEPRLGRCWESPSQSRPAPRWGKVCPQPSKPPWKAAFCFKAGRHEAAPMEGSTAIE